MSEVNRNKIRAEILEKAAELIENNGWWRGPKDKYRGDDVYCAYTALFQVGQRLSNLTWNEWYNGFYTSAINNFYLIELKFLTKNFSEITRWNDHPEQTKENVISHLRFVASEYRKRALKNEQ